MNLGKLQSSGDVDVGIEDSIRALLVGIKRKGGASKTTEEEDVSENQAVAKETSMGAAAAAATESDCQNLF